MFRSLSPRKTSLLAVLVATLAVPPPLVFGADLNVDSFTLDNGMQVVVIPQREGRFYLNVSASFETEDGTLSTITAIPIQVGTGTRELQQNGEVELDESGETVRVLSNDS